MSQQPVSQQIEYEIFASVDIRVGKVVGVQPFPRARKPAYKVTVDFGELGTKQSSAQITSYTPEQLIGTLVTAVVNMPERNIGGFISQILILGAANSAGEVILLTPRSDVAPGQQVF